MMQYTQHVGGKLHQKKVKSAAAAAAFSTSSTVVVRTEGSNTSGFCCTLCNVSCSGPEALQFHLAGAKHLKTLKQRSITESTAAAPLSVTAQASNILAPGIAAVATNRPSALAARGSQFPSGITTSQPQQPPVAVDIKSNVSTVGDSGMVAGNISDSLQQQLPPQPTVATTAASRDTGTNLPASNAGG
jgi:hypothetical protein